MGLIYSLYKIFYNYMDGNHHLISRIGGCTTLFTVFWALNGLLLLIETTGWPKWVSKYKVQPNEKVDKKKLTKAILVALFYTTIASGFGSYNFFNLQKWRGCHFRPDQLPSAVIVLRDLIGCAIIQEAAFYYSHRILHIPWLYKNVHYFHHQWTAPIGIISVYAHPVEAMFSNTLVLLSGPLAMGSHVVTFWIWYTVALFGTIMHHSGYHLPLLPSPEFHDYHHRKINQNYGTFGWLDKLHGTSEGFRKSVDAKRHQMLHSLRPMRVLFPDKKEEDAK